MSSLKENRCYGLSGGDRSRAHVSVFHVKLTDSAARAIEDGKSISVPRSENTDELRVFHFGLTNVARDNPNGSFDCFQQRGSGSAEELSCLGVIQKKMTVNATDDSYEKARQSMTQAEEETRSRGAIVIKQGGRLQGKKVTVRAPGPALAGLTKPRHPDKSRSLLGGVRRGVVQTAAAAATSKPKRAACASNGKSAGGVQERQLGERLAHLLALRPYKRPEIILRLQKDGLTASDKDLLDSELMEVGQLNSRDNTFVLKDGLYKELQRDWPGYSSGDQQLLKRIFVRRLFQPQHNLLAVPEAQVSPLRDTPNSSPAHPPKPPPPEDYTDPLASKKPRISRLSGKTSGARPAGKRDTLDPRTLFDSLSAVCRRGADVAERLEAPPRAEEGPRVAAPDPPRPAPARPPSPLAMPELSRHTIKRKKSKHKRRDQEKDRSRARKERSRDLSSEDPNGNVSLYCIEPSEILFESGDDAADYLLKYAAISSPVQRQRYKLDFNTEYSEYRDLHARIDGVTRQFMELDTQLKRLHHESHKYKTVRNQILQEYRKIKKSNPNYNQDKTRCEHLHNKLAHIKKLISEYDRQQL
ncbi:RNA polymerase II elongation factor ELL-like isoform X2 [Cyclopterus lumpus]|uniref:RNA polymerase II elongation factor ELL-like isoform X2 n=1 Tax=Cyclopterus lumpus TaxID=8103 RepID=UPI001486B027|nr:RNA polymerase II elongation factor ELL-like isoform X2 [Cyclopterus lumpus]